MSVDLNINVADGDALKVVSDKLAKCDPHRVATRVAVKASQHWRRSLAALPHNRKSWPSTGFWEDAARRVTGVAVGPNAVLSSDKLGLRQRLRGGEIRAVKGKYLTIPICAEAYGTSVSDWGYENLTLVVMADGRKFVALWLGSEAAQDAFKKHLGKLTKRAETTLRRVQRFNEERSDVTDYAVSKRGLKAVGKPDVIFFRGSGSGSSARAERHANLKFLFVLKESVSQAATPGVIPDDLGKVALDAVQEAIR